MPGPELFLELDETPPFRVVDTQKRSRFNDRDGEKLMLIVTRRKTYSTPHGKGETEWQTVADELNQAIDAAFSLRACRDKVAALVKKHKQEAATRRRASGVTETHTRLSGYIEAYRQLKARFEEKQ
ncbi:hypothetical protein PHMEG_00012219 [Phytophthora megakarya]|uniref:Uncharacterized protein n=1 Tax=Phytophthora megakarya TaxID=4795 RepID=A0A225WAZ9_9STRA|nr:hypothetical protein PHMEG_00012219 [Phytophthora megakarya]